MVDYEFVSQFVFENLLRPSVSSDGTSFIARCPFCGDSKKSLTKRRFSLKYNGENSIYFNCFNCPASGNFYDLYAHIKGLTVKEAMSELNKFSPENVKRKLSKKTHKEVVEEVKENKTADLTYILADCLGVNSKVTGFKDKKLQEILIKFKQDRKISTPVFVAYKGTWKDRIIIPIIENKRIIYFQGRTIYPDLTPKYLNPSIEKEHIIYQREKFDLTKFIVVTEGLLDAASIGTQGTACLGASISDIFLSELTKLSSNIIIALDNDSAGMEKLDLFLTETKYQFKFFLMPEKYKHIKDLNELKVKEEIDDMYEFVVKNSYSRLSTAVKLKAESWRTHLDD